MKFVMSYLCCLVKDLRMMIDVFGNNSGFSNHDLIVNY